MAIDYTKPNWMGQLITERLVEGLVMLAEDEEAILREHLAPCRFCGCSDLSIDWGPPSYVHCEGCCASGPANSNPCTTIDSWNKAWDKV